MPKTKSKILLIEDDEFLYKILMIKLKQAGFDALLAVDGQEGIARAKKVKPDLILLDLILPKINGFEVLEEVKKDPHLKEVPVVILSNLGQNSDVKKGLKMGATDYLVKTSLSLNEMVEKVKSYINN